MADYYPLITRAVAGLEKSTGEGRRALYERARNALVEQLRSVTPALSETDITRERLALEEAIRKVEAEAVRQLRSEPPAERIDTAGSQGRDLDVEHAPRPDAGTPATESGAPPEQQPDAPVVGPPRRFPERRWLSRKPTEPKEPSPGIKGFSDVVADAENLGNATAEASRAARETYSSVPSPTPEFDRLEPRLDSAARRPASSSRNRLAERRGAAQPDHDAADDAASAEPASYGPPAPSGRPLPSPMIPDSLRQVVDRARREQDEDSEPGLGRRLMGGMFKLGIAALVLALLAGTLWWQRDNLLEMVRNTFMSAKAPTTQMPPRETAQPRTKIPDRIAQGDNATGAGQQAEAPIAQRAVLYEDDPVEPAGRQFVGTVTWRTENSPPAAGQPPDRAVRADITIPERNMQISMVLRRNTDPGLTASHTVSIMFTLPPDFPNGGISEIRGMLMKQAEDTRGTSLAGLAVKVTPTFFLVGLSSASDADVQRNLQLLKERAWFDIAIVYTNGRRAILAVEKGPGGDRAFTEAFAAWGQ